MMVLDFETWHVEWVNRDSTMHIKVCNSWGSAQNAARDLRDDSQMFVQQGEKPLYYCIRVTGPHIHKVPN